jgi:hypothetical protein
MSPAVTRPSHPGDRGGAGHCEDVIIATLGMPVRPTLTWAWCSTGGPPPWHASGGEVGNGRGCARGVREGGMYIGL